MSSSLYILFYILKSPLESATLHNLLIISCTILIYRSLQKARGAWIYRWTIKLWKIWPVVGRRVVAGLLLAKPWLIMKGYIAFIWSTFDQLTNFHEMLHRLLVYVRASSVLLLCIYHSQIRILLIATDLPVNCNMFGKIPCHNNWYFELTPTILLAVLSAKENAQKVGPFKQEKLLV